MEEQALLDCNGMAIAENRKGFFVREYVTFYSSIPDDSVWEADDRLLIPGGKAILTGIRTHLVDAGYYCDTAMQESYYGWTLDAKKNNKCSRLLLQNLNPWLLIIYPRKSVIERIIGYDYTVYNELRNIVHAYLSSVTLYSRILWFTKYDYEHNNTNNASQEP